MGLPESNLLPGPLWLLTVLHLLTLTLHFVAMNFVLGGTLAVLFGRFGSDRWNNPTVKRLVKLLPSGMAAAINLGVAPLLFLQVVYPKQVYSASIVSGWFWLSIVLATAVAYYGFYAASFTRRGGGAKALFLGAAAVGLLYVSAVFTSVLSLAEMPALARSLYAEDQSGLVFNPELRSWVWRWCHMVLAAVSVGGFFVWLVARDDETGFKVGKSLFIGAMAVTSVAGFLHLLTLGPIMAPLMRGAGAWWLTAGVGLAFVSLRYYLQKRFLATGSLLFGSIASMVVLRHTIRLIRLGEELVIPPLRAQWLVLGIFLVCFVIALAVFAWMLKLFFEDKDAVTD